MTTGTGKRDGIQYNNRIIIVIIIAVRFLRIHLQTRDGGTIGESRGAGARSRTDRARTRLYFEPRIGTGSRVPVCVCVVGDSHRPDGPSSSSSSVYVPSDSRNGVCRRARAFSDVRPFVLVFFFSVIHFFCFFFFCYSFFCFILFCYSVFLFLFLSSLSLSVRERARQPRRPG